MNLLPTPLSDATSVQLEAGLARLTQIIGLALNNGNGHRCLGPLWAMRWTQATQPMHGIYHPMLCVIAQGRKQLHVGDQSFIYGPGHFLLNSVTVPAIGQVIEATPEAPCIWIMVELDPSLIVSVITEAHLGNETTTSTNRAMDTGMLNPELLEAVIRLAELFSVSNSSEFLLQLRLKEVIYQLLLSEQGAQLRQILTSGSIQHILRAIEWMKTNFSRPITVPELAEMCNMSPSNFHNHFKKVSAISPLQYLKQIRLQEALRLMLSEGYDAAHAAQAVGYDDPAYFSREYRQYFGAPPRKHAEQVRNTATYTNNVLA